MVKLLRLLNNYKGQNMAKIVTLPLVAGTRQGESGLIISTSWVLPTNHFCVLYNDTSSPGFISVR